MSTEPDGGIHNTAERSQVAAQLQPHLTIPYQKKVMCVYTYAYIDIHVYVVCVYMYVVAYVLNRGVCSYLGM